MKQVAPAFTLLLLIAGCATTPTPVASRVAGELPPTAFASLIQQLRGDMRATGKSLREFHDAFVSQGALPVSLLRKILLR